MIGQFRTVASFGPGFYLAVLASILILVGLYFQRKAYKPLADAAKEDATSEDASSSEADEEDTLAA